MLVDTLVLELGLDPRKFTEQQRAALTGLRQFQEEAERGGKRVESETKRIGNVLQDFRREAVTVLGVFLGGRGIKEFIGYVTSLDAQTGRLAKSMGLTANELGVWGGAFKQVGGSVESAQSTLGGLNQELIRFASTGQSSIIGVLTQLGTGFYNELGKLKTASELYLDIIKAIEDRKLTAREGAGFMSMLGLNQDAINLALKGTAAVREYLRAAQEAGATTRESAAAAEEYQRSLAKLETSATNLGRQIVTFVTPALVGAFDAMSKFIKGPSDEIQQKGRIELEKMGAVAPGGATWVERKLSMLFGQPANGMQYHWWSPPTRVGPPVLGSARPGTPAPTASAAPATPSSGNPTSREQESYIRAAAIKRGIDPNIAVDVARSEGLNRYVGDQGTSFGPFQLHYKNNIPGLSNSGLGDEFTKRTGKHASDPSTWQHQVDFALDEAKKSGWGAWHGWKGLPSAGLGRMPGAGAAAGVGGGSAAGDTNTTTSVQIGTIQVNAPNAKDGEEVGRTVGPAITRSVTAGFANTGAQ